MNKGEANRLSRSATIQKRVQEMEDYDVQFINYEGSKESIRHFFETSVCDYDFGNDLLYSFCYDQRLRPQSSQQQHANEKSDVKADRPTEQEAAFADQMWLIGRGYAASPQRYSYKNKIKKPSEDHLGAEGYESYFSDIARTLLRWQRKAPIVYLRGNRVELSKSDAQFCSVRKAIDVLDGEDADDMSFSSIGISTFLEVLVRLRDAKYNFDFDIEKTNNVCFDIPEKDLILSCITADLVIQFAHFISAARLLRDMAIIKDSKKLEASDGELREELGLWEKTLEGGEQSLNISFSSKFLHFQLPNIFFIYDSISTKNAGVGKETHLKCNPNREIKAEFRSKPNSVFKAFKEKDKRLLNGQSAIFEDSEIMGEYVSGLSRRIDQITSTPEDSDGASNGGKRYFVHAIKELAFARIIHDALLEADCPKRHITRNVDILISNWERPKTN